MENIFKKNQKPICQNFFKKNQKSKIQYLYSKKSIYIKCKNLKYNSNYFEIFLDDFEDVSRLLGEYRNIEYISHCFGYDLNDFQLVEKIIQKLNFGPRKNLKKIKSF